MPRPALLRFAAVLAAVALAAAGCARENEAGSTDIAIGGPFSLVDHTGRRVTEQDFLGKPFLVFFGFTNCPDACPLAFTRLGLAFEEMGADAERFQTLFITVDPERDTPEQMALYVHSNGFPNNLIGLTGTPEEIRAVADAYRAHYRKIESPETVAEYSMQHPTTLYLMDADGRFAAVIHPSTPAEIADGLRRYLDERHG
jgi:protein SCO1/2